METENKKDLNLFWKLGFMLLLGIVLGLILSKTVLALSQDEMQFKWDYCNAMNKTGIDCDNWYESFLDMYGLRDKTNLTETYNKTEIDKKFAEYLNSSETESRIQQMNNSNNQGFNSTEYATVDYVDKKDREISNSTGDRIDRIESGKLIETSENTGISLQNLIIILGIVFILGGGIYFLANKKYKSYVREKREEKRNESGDDEVNYETISPSQLMEKIKQQHKQENLGKKEFTEDIRETADIEEIKRLEKIKALKEREAEIEEELNKPKKAGRPRKEITEEE